MTLIMIIMKSIFRSIFIKRPLVDLARSVVFYIDYIYFFFIAYLLFFNTYLLNLVDRRKKAMIFYNIMIVVKENKIVICLNII